MTSFGVKSIAIEHGFMTTFRIQGQLSHYIGSIYPEIGHDQSYLQIYFVGDKHVQRDRRCSFTSGLDPIIVLSIQEMLHLNNNLVKTFKSAIEHIGPQTNYKVVINANMRPTGSHARVYNEPTTNDVACVLIGEKGEKRDIVLQTRSNELQRVSETHISYDALQYPLIFCRGEDGFHIKVSQVNKVSKEPYVEDPKKNHFLLRFLRIHAYDQRRLYQLLASLQRTFFAIRNRYVC